MTAEWLSFPLEKGNSGGEADKHGIISIICACIVTRITASSVTAQNAIQFSSSQRLGGSTDGEDRGVAYLRHHHARINIRPRKWNRTAGSRLRTRIAAESARHQMW